MSKYLPYYKCRKKCYNEAENYEFSKEMQDMKWVTGTISAISIIGPDVVFSKSLKVAEFAYEFSIGIMIRNLLNLPFVKGVYNFFRRGFNRYFYKANRMIGLERSQNNAIIRLFMNGVSASAFGIKKGASALTSIFRRILSVPTRTKMISEIVTTTEKSYGLRSLNNLIESKLMKLCKTKRGTFADPNAALYCKLSLARLSSEDIVKNGKKRRRGSIFEKEAFKNPLFFGLNKRKEKLKLHEDLYTFKGSTDFDNIPKVEIDRLNYLVVKRDDLMVGYENLLQKMSRDSLEEIYNGVISARVSLDIAYLKKSNITKDAATIFEKIVFNKLTKRWFKYDEVNKLSMRKFGDIDIGSGDDITHYSTILNFEKKGMAEKTKTRAEELTANIYPIITILKLFISSTGRVLTHKKQFLVQQFTNGFITYRMVRSLYHNSINAVRSELVSSNDNSGDAFLKAFDPFLYEAVSLYASIDRRAKDIENVF